MTSFLMKCSYILLLLLNLTYQISSEQQIVYCAYSPAENQYFDGFGGSLETFDNGTAKCILDDDVNRLVCMSIFDLGNITDIYGNVTGTEIRIRGQGCWSQTWNDLTQCAGSSEKCQDTQSAPGRRTTGFCCCMYDHCNAVDNIEFLPYVEEEDIVISPDEKPFMSQSDVYITIILVIVIILIAVVCVVFYIYRRRQQQKTEAMEEKERQYNYEMRIYSDEPPLVNYDDMKLEACLHRGRFGDVYKAKLNDEDVCVKYFHLQQRPLFYNEKDIYAILDPTNKTVVQCLACDERAHLDGSVQYIVIMEYVPLGSLSAYLKSHTISWKELCSLGHTAAAGIGYLHSEMYTPTARKHAIVHRDINSRNILVRPDMTCAIADMGFAMKIRGSKLIRNGTEEHAEDGSLRDVGTIRYMAPEILDCAVNLKDCESSLKQIDIYAFSLVLWELVTRCRDILHEKGDMRYMLPFEEELGTHPDFERMRIFVAKDHNRPKFPINLKVNEATNMLRDTIEECWDTDAEARLTALCIAERVKDVECLIDNKGVPILSKNDTQNKGKLSLSDLDIIHTELSPLLEQDTPASESNTTAMTSLSPDSYKADVNIEMDRDRQLAPRQGRNIVAERNTCNIAEEELAVHDNKLIPVQEAKARQAAEEERSRRHWEENQHQYQESGRPHRVSRPPARTVQLDIHNEVRDPNKRKENNLNRRRHCSTHNLNESSTSSNGGAGMIVTVPVTERPSRPKSLNLNIKPEDC